MFLNYSLIYVINPLKQLTLIHYLSTLNSTSVNQFEACTLLVFPSTLASYEMQSLVSQSMIGEDAQGGH